MQKESNLLLYPFEDIDTALPFVTEGLGLAIKFRSGNRYCALDAGAGDRRGAAGGAAGAGVQGECGGGRRRGDTRLVKAGATVAQPAAQGPHETRAVLQTPEGFAPVISTKASSR